MLCNMHLRIKQDKQKKHEDKREESRGPNGDQHQFPPKDIRNTGKRLGYEN